MQGKLEVDMSRIIKIIIILVLFICSNIFCQDWYDSARKSGTSVEQTINAQNDDGAYKVLTNWSKGYIEFSASATADMSKVVNDGQAITQAKKTASYLAYIEAAKFLEGVFVKEEVKMGGSIAISDKALGQVQGTIKNAIEINDQFEWMPNKSGIGTYPWATVTLGLLIYGGKPDQNLITSLFPESVNNTISAGITKFEITPKQIKKVNKEYPDLNQSYTGIIFDTRGFNVKPSMFPNIIVENTKQQVFGNLNVERDYLVKNGIAGFATDLETAKNDNRVSENNKSNCFVVQADSYNSDYNAIEISAVDAKIVSVVDMANDIFKECQVMVVVDK